MCKKGYLIKCFIFSIILSMSAADSCLAKLKPYFATKQVNIVYSSATPEVYSVETVAKEHALSCKTTFKELQEYLATNYSVKDIPESGVVQAWNYLAINNQVVYDFLAELNPQQLKAAASALAANSDFKNYTLYSQANYHLNSIVNHKYACYYHQQWSMASGMAHPNTVTELICSGGDMPKPLRIKQLANEQQVVSQLLRSKELQSKLTSKSIASYSQLRKAMLKSNNPELACIASSITANNTGFNIDKLNKDGTIDITLGLTSDIHVCSNIFIPVKLHGLKPKFKITQLTAVL